MVGPVNGNQPSLGGVGLESSSGVRGADLVGADQETAMLSVQGERGRLLDKQIETQIQELRALNRRLELLNTVQAGLKAVQAQFNAGAKYDKEWDDAHGGWSFRQADSINRAAAEAGINLGFSSDVHAGNVAQVDAADAGVAHVHVQDKLLVRADRLASMFRLTDYAA